MQPAALLEVCPPRNDQGSLAGQAFPDDSSDPRRFLGDAMRSRGSPVRVGEAETSRTGADGRRSRSHSLLPCRMSLLCGAASLRCQSAHLRGWLITGALRLDGPCARESSVPLQSLPPLVPRRTGCMPTRFFLGREREVPSVDSDSGWRTEAGTAFQGEVPPTPMPAAVGRRSCYRAAEQCTQRWPRGRPTQI